MARKRLIPPIKLPANLRLPSVRKFPLRRRLLTVATIEMTTMEVEAPSFEGTSIEWMVFRWLEQHKIEFSFQSSLRGGRMMLGGAVADFILPEYRMVWRVQGTYFHMNSAQKEANDIVQKQWLIDDGYQVIDLWEEQIRRSVNAVCQAALRGVELPRIV